MTNHQSGGKMPSHVKIVLALMILPCFVAIHFVLSLLVFSFAFGVAEAGNSSIAVPLSILGCILMPFVVLADWLTPPLPDFATLPVGILCSSLFWYIVSLKFILLKLEA
jgi:hypothetical protein